MCHKEVCIGPINVCPQAVSARPPEGMALWLPEDPGLLASAGGEKSEKSHISDFYSGSRVLLCSHPESRGF